MARALRLQFPGAIYHVTTRGNERRSIYRDDADRRRFLEKLEECVEIHHIRLYAFVLMSNHFHLLAETPRANLVVFMQQFNSSYSIYFNCRHGRSGHLFGGRYKAKMVEGDEYKQGDWFGELLPVGGGAVPGTGASTGPAPGRSDAPSRASVGFRGRIGGGV